MNEDHHMHRGRGRRFLHRLDILDTLNWATKTYGAQSSDDRSFVRGMLKTIALLQGYEEG